MSAESAIKTLVHGREAAEAAGGFNLKHAFANFDLDGGGTIDHDELTKVLLSIIPDLAYDEILAVIDMFDPNHDGEVAYVEFAHTFYNCEVQDNKVKARKAMVRIRRMASTQKGFHLKEAFRRFDKDGDGSVSHDELKVVISDILMGDISEDEMQAVRPPPVLNHARAPL
jgi:calmodulin